MNNLRILEDHKKYIALTDKLYENQDKLIQAIEHYEEISTDIDDHAFVLVSVFGRYQAEVVHLMALSAIHGHSMTALLDEATHKYTKKTCGCEQRHFDTPKPICKECEYDDSGTCVVCMHEKKCHPSWKGVYGRNFFEDEDPALEGVHGA